jgi:hypothetical protein
MPKKELKTKLLKLAKKTNISYRRLKKRLQK